MTERDGHPLTKVIDYERLLDALIELEVIQGRKLIAPITPGHGPCCTCQDCGYLHEECVCQHNEIIERLQALT